MSTTNAVIFAGGASKRMGKDKALLAFQKHDSLAEYQYEKLKNIFQNVYISTKENKFDFDANLILDKYSQSSPMIAIVSIFEELNVDYIFILAVDTPFVDNHIIQTILSTHNKLCQDQVNTHDILVARSPNGIEPLCGIFSSNVLYPAKQLLDNNEHKIKTLLKLCNTKTILFQEQEKFLNINNSNDYNKAVTY